MCIRDSFGANPIGTGPYKLKEAVEGDYYTLERFDDYWGGPAKTKLLTMKIVPEASQRTMMLETGEVDVAYEVPNNDISRIQEMCIRDRPMGLQENWSGMRCVPRAN